MSNPIDVIVGKNLRELRVQKGWSQDQLGEAVGVSFQQIQKYEHGANRISASRLVELANCLGVELESLFLGVAGELKEPDTKALSAVRKEHRLASEYQKLPDDVQDAVANLVKAIFVNLGQHFRGGVQ